MVLSSPQWNLDTIKHIIRQNSSFINEPKFHGRTLLQVMVCDEKGTEDMVNFLIDHNADVNAAHYNGYLLLEALCQCRKKNKQNIVKLLLEKGVNVPDTSRGESALSRAVEFGYGTDILKMITDRGADPNHINRISRSVLCVALAFQQTLEVFEFLLAAGATVTSCKMHLSPIHCIVCGDPIRSNIVALMVQNGARGNEVLNRNHNEKTLIHYALMNCKYETEAMEILILSDESFNVNARDNKDSTMLHDALFNRHCQLDMVKQLIDLGARVGSVDYEGDTPLHKAVRCHPDDPGFVRVLLKSGSPVNVTNRAGETALHIAYKMEQGLEILRLLMGSGELVFRHPVSVYQITYPRTSAEIGNIVRQNLMAIVHRHQQILIAHVRRVRQPESSISSLAHRVQQLSMSSSHTVQQPLMAETQTVQQPYIAVNTRLCNLDYPILLAALQKYESNRSNRNLNYLQTLLKYSLLENPTIDVYNFFKLYSNSLVGISRWVPYWYECLRDIERMTRRRMSHGLELLSILGYDFDEPRRNRYDTFSDDNKRILLSIVSNREFPYYTEIIAAKLPYEFLKEVFPGIHLFTVKYFEPRNRKTVVALNWNCLENMAKYLPYNELLVMILLFHTHYKQW